MAGQVTLAGDEAGTAIVADAFDEVDLGLLPALDDAVVDVVVRLVDDPVGSIESLEGSVHGCTSCGDRQTVDDNRSALSAVTGRDRDG